MNNIEQSPKLNKRVPVRVLLATLGLVGAATACTNYKVGQEVVVEKDTTLVIDYNVWNKEECTIPKDNIATVEGYDTVHLGSGEDQRLIHLNFDDCDGFAFDDMFLGVKKP